MPHPAAAVTLGYAPVTTSVRLAELARCVWCIQTTCLVPIDHRKAMMTTVSSTLAASIHCD